MKAKKSKKETTINELAAMVARGFSDVQGKMDEGFKDLKEELKSDIADVKVDLNQKVHIFDHKSLEFRVDRLEEKVGITRKR